MAAICVYFMMDTLTECLTSAVKVCRFTHKQTALQEQSPSKWASGDTSTSTCPFLHQWICVCMLGQKRLLLKKQQQKHYSYATVCLISNKTENMNIKFV